MLNSSPFAQALARRLPYYAALAHAEGLDLQPEGSTPGADVCGRLSAWQNVTTARVALSDDDMIDAVVALDLAEKLAYRTPADAVVSL